MAQAGKAGPGPIQTDPVPDSPVSARTAVRGRRDLARPQPVLEVTVAIATQPAERPTGPAAGRGRSAARPPRGPSVPLESGCRPMKERRGIPASSFLAKRYTVEGLDGGGGAPLGLHFSEA